MQKPSVIMIHVFVMLVFLTGCGKCEGAEIHKRQSSRDHESREITVEEAGLLVGR